MSSFTTHLHGGSVGPSLPASGYTASLRRFAGRLADAWRHHREELELESLPYDLRKDIGFPSTDEGADLTSISRKTR